MSFYRTVLRVCAIERHRRREHTSCRKFKLFKGIKRLRTFSDMRMLIEMFVFYAPWIPFYEVRVLPFCNLLKKSPDTKSTNQG